MGHGVPAVFSGFSVGWATLMLDTAGLTEIAGVWLSAWALGYGAGLLFKAFRQLADKMTG